MFQIYLLLIIYTTVQGHKDTYSDLSHQRIRKHVVDDDPNVVHTPLGNILGSTSFKTRLGKIIYSFHGIRYAEPPIGKKRFQPPEPVKPWNEEILNATEDGPACPQPIRIPPEFGYRTSEDCLRLNVYTVEQPKKLHDDLRPVVVFFHPGGFYSRSGISNFHGPQYLLDENIVLVTVNYRLGPLGFISTGDENAPGNLGLKDQVIALRWVKNNVKAFAGNPDEVTIMGYSAGSYSVALHLVSPMSEGLFHRAISMSSSPTGAFNYSNQLYLAEKQAELLNCPSDTSKKIIDCLKTKDAEEISTTFFSFQEVGSNPILIWRPVIEPEHSGERFLTDDPTKLFNEGRFKKVPFMVGINENEFAGGAYSVVLNDTLRGIWNNNFSYVAPIAFVYERNTTKSFSASRALREFYLDDVPINVESVDRLGKLFADGVTGWRMHRLANLVAKSNDSPVYHYKFAYKGRYSHFYSPLTNQSIGPVHHDELIYLFYMRNPVSFPFFESNDPEIKMVEKMTKLWGNFIRTGNPTPKKQDITDNIIWNPLTESEINFMNIDLNLSMRKNLFADRYAFWDNLFPISN